MFSIVNHFDEIKVLPDQICCDANIAYLNEPTADSKFATICKRKG